MKIPGFVIILSSALVLSACGNKSNLNIPETPPPDALQTELTVDSLLNMARRLEAAGDLNSAGSFYADVIEQDDTVIAAHLGLGRVLTAIGQGQAAAISFGRAWRLQPQNQENLGLYLKALLPVGGEFLALEAIDDYLEDYPATPDILNYRGLAFVLTGRFGEAENAFREGLGGATIGSPLHGRLLGNLALSLGLGDKTSEAVLLLNPYIGDMRLGNQGISPYQSGLRQNLALVYALAGNPDSAVEVAKSALSEADAEYNRPFYEGIARLQGINQVRAVFLGELPDNSGS